MRCCSAALSALEIRGRCARPVLERASGVDAGTERFEAERPDMGAE